MPANFGYTLSSEEHGPTQLVENAVRAEELGFDFCSLSDHFHPWTESQGHSPFAWGVLGAIAQGTAEIELLTGVTCPIIRTHPTVIGHAAATTSLLSGGRFSLGVGTGENLNEHINGDRWPPPEERLAMLEEAVEVMRALWTGETIDYAGEFYDVVNARLFDPPAVEVPVVVSGFGDQSVQLAARIGDGLWTSGPESKLIDQFGADGGEGPVYGQIHVCCGSDEETCRKVVYDVWPNAALPGQLAQELPTWTHFEQAVQLVTPDAAAKDIPCGPDIQPILDAVNAHLDAGYTRIYFHQIGPDQDALFATWESELGDAVRAIAG
jgi:G6PDH family F420-dependent oxidoreductase